MRWSTLSAVVQALRTNVAERGYFTGGEFGIWNATTGGQIVNGVISNATVTRAPVVGKGTLAEAEAEASGAGLKSATAVVSAVPSTAGPESTTRSVTLKTVAVSSVA